MSTPVQPSLLLSHPPPLSNVTEFTRAERPHLKEGLLVLSNLMNPSTRLVFHGICHSNALQRSVDYIRGFISKFQQHRHIQFKHKFSSIWIKDFETSR